MNIKTNSDSSILTVDSPLFSCTLVIPVAIIGLGINFILNPVGASTGFGIPIHDPAAFPFMWIRSIAIVIPSGDGLVILTRLGFAPPIFIHWVTAHYMMIVAAFLLRRKKP